MAISTVELVASHLLAARNSGVPISTLHAHPASLKDAFAVQDRVAQMLGRSIGGWKAGFADGATLRGAILADTILPSGATYTPDRFTLGYEGEVAFRFERALPARAAAYTRQEVASSVSLLPTIEIVASRFAATAFAPAFDRIADANVNGGMVTGTAIADWSAIDLANLSVTFEVDGKVVLERKGGHPAGDPFAPALALANDLRSSSGIEAGRIITTGAPTGCIPVEPGSEIIVTFASVGSVSLKLANTK